ncbi:hypothetical protein GPECTOR_31g326 [Gonium pectorale]|uniref:Thioredoxin domain-containing protein n=1 Tax=Gonium pectorale TaxID=33097 RepID=A0A150GDP7_GONPE|nr:hypothetical protein GPECTOR_31g326 [Gonium pectorale]|eukprot:KXZ47964.1 hypothetical protein GPECTOR_31g326 [Gonium pectorale]
MAGEAVGIANVGSAQDVQAAVARGKPVVLAFWASWCEPCRHMDTVLAQLAAELQGLSVLRVEAEVVDEVTEKYGVTTVPYFVFLRGGEVVDRVEGADPPALTAKATALARGGGAATTSGAGAAGADAGVNPVFGRIKFLLAQWPVVLFMKGSADTPRCGFSRRVVEALEALGVGFKTVDILQDEEIRQGLKEYSNWPTYPQLYVKGELVGGCDIVMEMAGSGDLEALMKDKLGEGFRAASKAAVAAPGAPAAAAAAPAPAPAPAPAAAAVEDPAAVRERIKALLSGPSAPAVMLFMKGSPQEPRCGFSRRVVEALQSEGIEFGSFDILQDEAIRQGLKEYGNWPTYPQLYVRGELVGGCDIVTEMKAAGELGSTIREMSHRMDVP